MAFALAVCSLLPAYAITLLPWSSFPVAVPVVAAMLVAYECLAQLCSHVPSVLLGMVLYLIAFLITFLFSGLFVKQSAVHYPLRPLLLASPMRLGYAAFSKVVFEASQTLPRHFLDTSLPSPRWCSRRASRTAGRWSARTARSICASSGAAATSCRPRSSWRKRSV